MRKLKIKQLLAASDNYVKQVQRKPKSINIRLVSVIPNCNDWDAVYKDAHQSKVKYPSNYYILEDYTIIRSIKDECIPVDGNNDAIIITIPIMKSYEDTNEGISHYMLDTLVDLCCELMSIHHIASSNITGECYCVTQNNQNSFVEFILDYVKTNVDIPLITILSCAESDKSTYLYSNKYIGPYHRIIKTGDKVRYIEDCGNGMSMVRDLLDYGYVLNMDLVDPTFSLSKMKTCYISSDEYSLGKIVNNLALKTKVVKSKEHLNNKKYGKAYPYLPNFYTEGVGKGSISIYNHEDNSFYYSYGQGISNAITTEACYLFDTPNMSICKKYLDKNFPVQIISSKGDMCYVTRNDINYDDLSGYIHRSFLKTDFFDDKPEFEHLTESNYTLPQMVVKRNNTKLYGHKTIGDGSSPSVLAVDKDHEMYNLEKDTMVYVLDIVGSYAFICYHDWKDNKRYGWIKKRKLKKFKKRVF